jgi:4-amino-4-deoxy-L-arabinose transferase-like glycosyltransferase
VCLWRLGTATVGVDEPSYADAGWGYVHGDWSQNIGHPLLAKQVLGLSQLVFGRGLWGIRLPGAVFALVTGLFLYDLGRRLVSRWVGLVAVVLWFALPQSPGTNVIRVDRYAVLEPAVVAFGVLSLWCLARWIDDERRGWLLAAGAALGLSASSKLPGVSYGLALVLVIVASQRAWRVRAMDVLSAATAAAVAFLVPYAFALGAAGEHLRALFHQVDHAEAGHPQLIAGKVRLHHPWWSNFWWQQTYLGVVATVVVWALAVWGLARLRGRRRLLVLGGLLGPLVFLTSSPLKLPHYHVILIAPLLLAAAVGLVDVVQRPLQLPRRQRSAMAAVALVAVACLAWPALKNLDDVARLRASDYAAVPALLAKAGVRQGDVAVWGWPFVLDRYLPDGIHATDTNAARPVAVVVDPVTADRQRGSDTEARVEQWTRGIEPISVDRLRVYLLPAAASA